MLYQYAGAPDPIAMALGVLVLALRVHTGQPDLLNREEHVLNWMLMPLRRYSDFSGRSRRKEYWMFVLFYLLAGIALATLSGMVGAFSGSEPNMLLLTPLLLLLLGLFIPSLAVQVRRLHDQNKSGWFVLLTFIPYIGGIILLVLMCIEGTRGSNRFGPDPKDPSGAQELNEVFR